jgi:hypothetical protein
MRVTGGAGAVAAARGRGRASLTIGSERRVRLSEIDRLAGV